MQKVLVITYYWPPAGGPGSQRVSKFCKYLVEMNWEPVVLTVANPQYQYIDASLNENIREINWVYKAKSLEPHKTYRTLINQTSASKRNTRFSTYVKRISNFIRVNCFIPDARIGWYLYAVNKGLEVIEKHKPAMIFSKP